MAAPRSVYSWDIVVQKVCELFLVLHFKYRYLLYYQVVFL